MSDKVVYNYENFESESVKILIDNIKSINLDFYEHLIQNMKRNRNLCIREDVLKILPDFIQEIPINQESLFHLNSILTNTELEPEWYQWIKECLINDSQISIGDFMVILGEIFDKKIPLDKVKELFETSENDLLKIYEKVDEYQIETYGENYNPDFKTNASSNEMSDEGDMSLIVKEDDNSSLKIQEKNVIENEKGDYVEMFDNLLTAITKGNTTNSSVMDAQDNFNRIMANIQVSMTELSVFATSVIREWSKDKEEIERLKAFHNIQQKVLYQQQQRINNMNAEIFRMNEKMESVKKSEMRREEIDRKILELQSLTSLTSNQNKGDFSYIDEI